MSAHERSTVDYAHLFAAMPSPYLVLTPGLVILEANHAYLEVTGRSRDELVGQHVFDAFPASPADPQGEAARNVRASLERARDSGQPDSMAIQRFDIPVPGTGDFIERYWSTVNIPVVGDDGSTILLLHRTDDVTDFIRERGRTQAERKRSEDWRRRLEKAEADVFARARELEERNRELREARDQLALRALHDPLTGLLVRWMFLEKLSHALARLARHPHPLAVLFIDLDRLKHVNDGYGHAAGDALIRICAERLKASVRPTDPVARIGGDEFVILLEDLQNADEVEVIAERILEKLNVPCRPGTGPVMRPTASIGVAVTEDTRMSADTLLSNADAAMYRAKHSGRGRYRVFDAAAYSAVTTRHQLETDLRTAVSDPQFELHYQPIIDLTTGATHAVEALLRWQHPTRGLLTAADFIDVAEDSGLIREVGDWVVTRACRQLAEWDAAIGDRTPERMFINLSVPELAHPRFDERLADAAAEAHIDPKRLVLEITETGMVNETSTIAGAVDVLLGLGCELAIDDFGTGYSSLSRLVQLPAGILKIDRTFVREVHRNHESAAIVSAVLLLGHNLRKTVVAEGVEDAEALAVLRELGCPYAQGFHIAHPLTPQHLAQRLSAAA